MPINDAKNWDQSLGHIKQADNTKKKKHFCTAST